MLNFYSWRHLMDSIFDSSGLGIGKDDFVIDVGCGASPFGRANLLVERFIGCSDERAKNLTPVLDRPAIIADASKLPFKNDGVDFLMSRHMIEHLEEPEEVMEEFSRVAKRGVLRGPSLLWEKVSGYDFHRWFLNIEDGVLVFREKERILFDDDISNFFWEISGNKDFQRLWWRNQQYFELSYEWSGKINYKVHRVSKGMVRSTAHDDPLEQLARALRTAKTPPTTPKKVKSALHKFIREKSSTAHNIKLEDVLVCPETHGKLEWHKDRLISKEAGKAYPLLEGCPIFTHTLPAEDS